jgi:hypothetical protein
MTDSPVGEEQDISSGRVATVRRDEWDAHWLRRRSRDPHRKADSFRYHSSLDLWPQGVRSVLDVAGGDGTFASLAREAHPEAEFSVIDQAPAAVETAGQRGFDAMVVSVDGRRLPFADESFDLVTNLSVLQDVLRPWSLLEELTRVSRRWVIVSCPNFASVGNRWDSLRGRVPRQMRFDSHVRFITYHEVVRHFEALGVRVAGVRTRHKLPLLRGIPGLPLVKPQAAHGWVPNLAAKFTVLGDKVAKSVT